MAVNHVTVNTSIVARAPILPLAACVTAAVLIIRDVTMHSGGEAKLSEDAK